MTLDGFPPASAASNSVCKQYHGQTQFPEENNRLGNKSCGLYMILFYQFCCLMLASWHMFLFTEDICVIARKTLKINRFYSFYIQFHKTNLLSVMEKSKRKIILVSFLVRKCNFGALLHRGINMNFSVEFTINV